MTHYLVISPEVSVGGYDEPTEYYHWVVSVEAVSISQAKILALKREEMKVWVKQARQDNKNPFSGLTIENPVCNHGVCWCDICEQECEECYKEADTVSNSPNETLI